MLNGKCIVWEHWVDAVAWDRLKSRKIHQKITEAHMNPSSSEKMRNHLAEEVLNNDMLYLMLCYKASKADGSHLHGTISLLEKTSKIIQIFNDRRPITSCDDERLQEL